MIRIGVLTPHGALGPEAELPAIAPGRVVTCVARVSPAGVGADPTTPSGLRALTTPPFLDEPADMLARSTLDVVVYASTSSAYAIGPDDEAAVVSRLSARLGLPVLPTCASAVQALRVLDVERVALVHPPWFDAELNRLGAAYFRSEGFDVVSSESAANSAEAIETTALCEWTSRHLDHAAEAVFVGGNGFRAAAAIAALESAIDRPVLTANQVLLWNLLTHIDGGFEVSGYGRLFLNRPRSQGVRNHGDRIWFLPSWLAWLPDVHVEGVEPPPRAALGLMMSASR